MIGPAVLQELAFLKVVWKAHFTGRKFADGEPNGYSANGDV